MIDAEGRRSRTKKRQTALPTASVLWADVVALVRAVNPVQFRLRPHAGCLPVAVAAAALRYLTMQNHHHHVLHAVHTIITGKIGPRLRGATTQAAHPVLSRSIYSIVDENQQRRRRLSLLSQKREQLLQKLKCPKTASSLRFSLRRILFAPPKSPPARQPGAPSWPPQPPRRRNRRREGSCSASDIGHRARWRNVFLGEIQTDFTKPLSRTNGSRGD